MNAGSRARWVALAVVCTGLAFLPMNMITAGLSARATARLVARFGIKPPLVGGLLLAAGLSPPPPPTWQPPGIPTWPLSPAATTPPSGPAQNLLLSLQPANECQASLTVSRPQ
jgi:hypothetical protein